MQWHSQRDSVTLSVQRGDRAAPGRPTFDPKMTFASVIDRPVRCDKLVLRSIIWRFLNVSEVLDESSGRVNCNIVVLPVFDQKGPLERTGPAIEYAGEDQQRTAVDARQPKSRDQPELVAGAWVLPRRGGCRRVKRHQIWVSTRRNVDIASRRAEVPSRPWRLGRCPQNWHRAVLTHTLRVTRDASAPPQAQKS